MKKNIVILILLMTIKFVQAQSYSHCLESVTKVVGHSNGNVYFNTNLSCKTHWCSLGNTWQAPGTGTTWYGPMWNTDGAKSRGLADLLTAYTTGKKVTFFWNKNPNCQTTENKPLTEPEYLVLEP